MTTLDLVEIELEEVVRIKSNKKIFFLALVVLFSLALISFKSSHTCIQSKQWPLAPNSRKWRITRANVSNASHIFPEMTFGECRRVWRVRHGILANLANLANFKARSLYVQKKDVFRYKTI